MPMRHTGFFVFLFTIFAGADALAQYVLVSPAAGVSVCNSASQRIIKVAPQSVANGFVNLVVTKTNATCGSGGTFGNPATQQGGRIDIHETSPTGPIVASVNYAYGVSSVPIQFQPTFETTYRDYYAVVGSDPNLYWDGPVKVRSFDLARSDGGVKLFKLEPDPAQAGAVADYVVEVNLSVARVRSILGAESGTATSGATSTRSKVVALRNAAQHWEQAKVAASGGPGPFVIVNFAFFSPETTKTIAFPMKIDGRVVSYGYELTGGTTGGGQWSGQYRYLAIDNNQNSVTIGTINHTSPSTLAAADQLTDSQATSAGQEFLGGLTSGACIGCTSWRPRTFFSAVDRTGDGRPELLIFSSEKATNDYAARILKHFKGTNLLQADGGGSAQLVVSDAANSTYTDDTGATITIVAGKILVRGENGVARRVPHVLAVYPNTP